MNHNDVLRRLRYALDLNDDDIVRLIGLGGVEITAADVPGYLARIDRAGFAPCPDAVLAGFLDGLVLERRGPRDPSAPAPPPSDVLDNNLILKKLRIALQLQQSDLLELLSLGGMQVTASELGALFRNPSHKHYKLCGNQLLRKFVDGLTTKLRGTDDQGSKSSQNGSRTTPRSQRP